MPIPSFELERMFPPTELLVNDELDILPLLILTPPIRLLVVLEFEIEPPATTKKYDPVLVRELLLIVHPPIVLDDVAKLEIAPLFRDTPPIEFDTLPGVEIAPVASILVSPLEITEFDSVHPPIVLEVPDALEMPSLLIRTFAIV
jgi:hypothetical protein